MLTLLAALLSSRTVDQKCTKKVSLKTITKAYFLRIILPTVQCGVQHCRLVYKFLINTEISLPIRSYLSRKRAAAQKGDGS